ncbi:MAG: VPLPA-CTERM sorting domain-containing protein [Aestuariivirga sp.]
MPSKSLKSSIYVGLMLLAFSGQAQSATLTGDFVAVNYNDSSLKMNNGSGIVGIGTDVTIGGGFYDFNAGAGGNQFVFSVNNRYCGVARCSGAIKLSLLDLNFSGGEKLIGFTLLSTALRGLSFTFTSTSLVFFATEGYFGRNVGRSMVISGIFLTAPPPVQNIPAAVPIPAALPLLGSALGFFVWMGRRRKNCN